jgi:propanol-preferring alcohol dehydrogenase
MLAPATHAAPLPASLDLAEVAPQLCAGLTVYKAIKSAGLRAGQRIAIFGAGGLGHLAIQIARAMGAQAGAIDIADDKLEFAKSVGAEWTMNAAEPVHKKIRSMGGVHVAMVCAASVPAYETALRCLRRGGTMAAVGMANEPFKVSAVSLISTEAHIVASAVGTRADLQELFALMEKHPIRCKIEKRPLDSVNQIFDEMKRGALIGRAVLTM